MTSSVLVVSYNFPPVNNPEGVLVGRTSSALAALGWQVRVLTVDARYVDLQQDANLLDAIPASVEIVRARPPLPASLYRHKRTGILLQMLGLPEREFLWLYSAYSAGLKELKAHPPDIIYSRASNFCSNVAGYALKKSSGLPWVAHFSDPWVDNPYLEYNPIQRWASARLEKAIIQAADGVEFTTQQTLDLVMDKYAPALKQKAFVTAHGFDPSQGALLPQSEPGSRLRILFTGSLYGKRTLAPLLNAIRKLDANVRQALQVTCIGYGVIKFAALVDELGLNDIVRLEDPVIYTEALRRLTQSDMLLVIDAPDPSLCVFLPSKLVDYLLVKKPILGLTPVKGASADFIRETGGWVTDPDDVPGIASRLEQLVTLWQQGGMVVSADYENVWSAYNIHTLTGSLERRFQALIRAASLPQGG